jgi:hypothetical protein
LGQAFLLPDSFNVPPDQLAHIHATEVSGLQSANLSTKICILLRRRPAAEKRLAGGQL